MAIFELKEELKKGVFRFVFERKNRTEKDGNQSINPTVPKQKPEVQTALEMLQKQRSEMVVRPIFPYVQRFKDKRLLGNVELLAKLLDTNHLETWEDVRAFAEKQTEVLAQQEQIQRNSSRVATDLARLSAFKGNLREMEAQQRADEQEREQNRDKKHENTI